MDREAWHAAVHRITKSLTWLSNLLNWTDIETQINIMLVEQNKLGYVPNWKKYEPFI